MKKKSFVDRLRKLHDEALEYIVDALPEGMDFPLKDEDLESYEQDLPDINYEGEDWYITKVSTGEPNEVSLTIESKNTGNEDDISISDLTYAEMIFLADYLAGMKAFKQPS